MTLASIEERLTGLPSLSRVASALALAAVLEKPPQQGVEAWVVPLTERPLEQQRVAGPALQRQQLTFGIVLAVRSLNDPLGDLGSARLTDARHQVRQRLFGWTPDGANVPCLLGNGDLLKLDQSTLWWLDRYSTAVQYRAASGS